VRNQTAGVELGENAGEAELVPQFRKTIGDHLRCADDRPGAARLHEGGNERPSKVWRVRTRDH
jgi:hypothetical protein